MKKGIIILVLVSVVVPSVAFASWWNPLSWKIFSFLHKKQSPVVLIQPTIDVPKVEESISTPIDTVNDDSEKIKDLQNQVDELKKQQSIPKPISTPTLKNNPPIQEESLSNALSPIYEDQIKSINSYVSISSQMRAEIQDMNQTWSQLIQSDQTIVSMDPTQSNITDVTIKYYQSMKDLNNSKVNLLLVRENQLSQLKAQMNTDVAFIKSNFISKDYYIKAIKNMQIVGDLVLKYSKDTQLDYAKFHDTTDEGMTLVKKVMNQRIALLSQYGQSTQPYTQIYSYTVPSLTFGTTCYSNEYLPGQVVTNCY